MSKGFDLSYRPSSYWGPQDLQKRYGSRIKGTLRNESVQSALERGESVPDLLLEDELDPVVKKVKGQMHPWNMGGEYLPDFIGDEVEIARVVLQSTTMDTTSVRARNEKGSIVYRVVDEYMEDDPNKFVIPISSSQKTLLMSQLIHIIDNVEDVFNGYTGLVLNDIEYMCDQYDDIKEISDFVTVTSVFYPDLHSYYEDQKLKWIKRILQN